MRARRRHAVEAGRYTIQTFDTPGHYYALAVQRQLHESDLYWTRNGAFLLAQGVLLGLQGNPLANGSLYRLLPAAAGLFLSVAWFLVLRRGKLYISRWETVISRLESDFPRASVPDQSGIIPLLTYFKDAQQAETVRARGFLGWETSQLMKAITMVISLLWIFAISAVLYGSSAETASDVVPVDCEEANSPDSGLQTGNAG